MNLCERILSYIKGNFPDLPEAKVIELAAFLTAECWNQINENVNFHIKKYFKEGKHHE